MHWVSHHMNKPETTICFHLQFCHIFLTRWPLREFTGVTVRDINKTLLTHEAMFQTGCLIFHSDLILVLQLLLEMFR